MHKKFVILSIALLAAIIIFQFIKIGQLEQRLTTIQEFVLLREMSPLSPLTEYDRELRNVLWDDLQQHENLIPFRGILGGTARYFSIMQAYKFDDNRGYLVIWAEDGHIGADMVLYYTISENGSIMWKLISYQMNSG